MVGSDESLTFIHLEFFFILDEFDDRSFRSDAEILLSIQRDLDAERVKHLGSIREEVMNEVIKLGEKVVDLKAIEGKLYQLFQEIRSIDVDVEYEGTTRILRRWVERSLNHYRDKMREHQLFMMYELSEMRTERCESSDEDDDYSYDTDVEETDSSYQFLDPFESDEEDSFSISI